MKNNNSMCVEKVFKKLYTVEELWWQKNPSDKCITITNDDNPNLKWIKIYKPRLCIDPLMKIL